MKLLGDDIDRLLEKHNWLPGDTWLEKLTFGCRELVQRDLNEQKHRTVRALLESVIHGLRVVGFEYYASYK